MARFAEMEIEIFFFAPSVWLCNNLLSRSTLVADSHHSRKHLADGKRCKSPHMTFVSVWMWNTINCRVLFFFPTKFHQPFLGQVN